MNTLVKIKWHFVILAVSLFFTFNVNAEGIESVSNTSYASTGSMPNALRRHIAMVMFCGLGGAVLGVSSLSFYGDPANHMNNITAGLAAGLIGGSAYVLVNSFQPPQNSNLALDPQKELQMRSQPQPSRQQLSWNFSF